MYYSRKPTRIPGFDYSSVHYYFVTICTFEKNCIFGFPGKLNWMGEIAHQDMQAFSQLYSGIRVDNFIIMPNHIHAIIAMECVQALDLSQVIGLYKSGVTRKIREKAPGQMVWQRSYHDHVIRNQSSYEKIWNYVEYNDQKWEEDCFYTKIERL